MNSTQNFWVHMYLLLHDKSSQQRITEHGPYIEKWIRTVKFENETTRSLFLGLKGGTKIHFPPRYTSILIPARRLPFKKRLVQLVRTYVMLPKKNEHNKGTEGILRTHSFNSSDDKEQWHPYISSCWMSPQEDGCSRLHSCHWIYVRTYDDLFNFFSSRISTLFAACLHHSLFLFPNNAIDSTGTCVRTTQGPESSSG